jgi:hypothetical protein
MLGGTVASAATASWQRDCWYENPPPSPCRYAIRLCRLPLPTRCHRPRGPLVPTLRPVLPRPRRAPGRARDRGRPRHHLPVGAAVHAAAGRRRPALPASRGRSLAGGRDLCEGGRPVAVRLPGDRPVRAVIDVFVSSRGDTEAAHRFLERAIGTTKIAPAEVSTDQAPVCPAVLEDLLPAAWHRTDR